MKDLIKGHAARVRAADPLVAGEDELSVKGRQEVIEARDAVGVASVDRIDPGQLHASWSPLVVHRLQARVAGADPEAALGALLDRWIAGSVAGRPGPSTGQPGASMGQPGSWADPSGSLGDLSGSRGDLSGWQGDLSGARSRAWADQPGQALSVTWPSRDTVPVKALAVRGFAPIAAAAVRRLRPGVATSPAIRRAGLDDLETVARMYERLVAYDAQFGWVTMRASTGARIRESVAAEVLPLEWCWLAEIAGQAVGCIIVQPPDRSRWISRSVNDAPVAYLGVMYVEPSARGRGVGAALTDVAQSHAAATGVSSMVLHHALPNPLSTPFWARRGYRPMITQWVRHLV